MPHSVGLERSSFPPTARGRATLELATYYYNTGAFEQARLYLDNLYKQDPSTYEMYLNTLLELEDFDAAEKVVKSRLKKRKDKSMANGLRLTLPAHRTHGRCQCRLLG